MSKKWIPVNENGQLWCYEYINDEGHYSEELPSSGYAIVLNNKPFVLIDQFHTYERTWFRSLTGVEINGHREIIYLV